MIHGKVKEKKHRKQEMFCSKYEWKHNLFKFEYVYKAEKVHKKNYHSCGMVTCVLSHV